MPLTFATAIIPDPAGHAPALRLKGDWRFVLISDGTHTGLGEISHSGDDAACVRGAGELFFRHVEPLRAPTLDAVRRLARGPFARARDFVAATAISGLDQALHDLIARRQGVPVWRLFRAAPVRKSVPAYATLNRALRSRDWADYRRVAAAATAAGFTAVKVAPFGDVVPQGNQAAAARVGLELVARLRGEFPRLSWRVDCHARFKAAFAAALVPRFDALALDWLEEPCAAVAGLAQIRRAAKTPIAAGELHFGASPFRRLLAAGAAGVIMPDVKHCGGFGPLLGICEVAREFGAQVSPHNPSGPVSTLASLQAGAISPVATSLEIPFNLDLSRVPALDLLVRGELRVPDAPGWGVTLGQLRRRYDVMLAA